MYPAAYRQANRPRSMGTDGCLVRWPPATQNYVGYVRLTPQNYVGYVRLTPPYPCGFARGPAEGGRGMTFPIACLGSPLHVAGFPFRFNYHEMHSVTSQNASCRRQ